MRHLDVRGRTTGDARERVQDFLEGHVSVAKNVSLTDEAALRREPMSFGNVLDSNNIEARIHVCGHSPAQEVDYDPSRRCWLPVTWPNRHRGIDDDCRKTSGCRIE